MNAPRSENADFLIVGAGIVGLTVARELRRRHPSSRILVLEKEAEPGRHASGRNSGVLHSGIYYTPGTLKARFCAEGARRMRDYAREKGIPCRVGGKVIVAGGDEDLPGLDRLMANARGNGIRAERLDERGVCEVEPGAAPFPGIHCRDTAVIDPLAVLRSLVEDLRVQGVELRFGERVLSAKPAATIVTSSRGGALSYRFLVNAAGAHADRIARMFGLAADHAIVPFKGIYHRLQGESAGLLRESLYPVPDLAFPFLGVHVTRGVTGDVYAGPTALPAFGREHYGRVDGFRWSEALPIAGRLLRIFGADDPGFKRLIRREVTMLSKTKFIAAARRLLPGLRAEDVAPSHKVGIRPQLVDRKTGRLEMDFRVERGERSLHVLNAISPAFTCSFAFASFLADQVSSVAETSSVLTEGALSHG